MLLNKPYQKHPEKAQKPLETTGLFFNGLFQQSGEIFFMDFYVDDGLPVKHG